jgi:hypothetical protein
MGAAEWDAAGIAAADIAVAVATAAVLRGEIAGGAVAVAIAGVVVDTVAAVVAVAVTGVAALHEAEAAGQAGPVAAAGATNRSCTGTWGREQLGAASGLFVLSLGSAG